jgi:hypothetical protein
MPPSVDFIYWTFSAAAQSISAFVALLLAGYAIVHSLMESARERDDTLEEVHAALRRQYHSQLSRLAWLTGAAVILSLAVVYANRPSAPVNGWALLGVSTLDVAAIVAGLYFVVTIVDPNKYLRAAKKAIDEEEPSPAQDRSPASEFFDAFVHLERLIRDYLRQHDLYVPSRGEPRMSYSFRQMLEALRSSEVIPHELYGELLELSKYRNLVFHGHVAQVDSAMVDRVRQATTRFRQLPQRGV